MARRALLAALLLVASCDWSKFDSLHDDASGIALAAPDGYPASGFGTVVAGYEGVLGTAHVSRVVVGAGADAPVRVTPLWDGTGIDLTTPTFIGCRNAGECEPGTGAAVTGIPAWRTASLCTVIGGAASGALDVHCEAGTDPTTIEHFPGPAGIGFGRSLAALPEGFGGGGLVAGAPTAAGGGAVYRVKSDTTISALALPGATTGAVALGSRLAVAPMPGGDVLVAATAPGLSTSRVVVFVLSGATGLADVRACIDDTHAGAMGAVALGDLDGDGVPDLAVGDEGAATGRRDSVQLYFGRDLPAASACGAWGGAAVPLACPAGLRGLACGGSGFGSALAIGDIDADGKGDVIVGAPTVTVSETTGAGAVYVFPGPAVGVATALADALTDSSPRPNAHLGQTVAVARSRGARSEVVAGAPGTGEAIVFLCSGLPNDGPSAGPHCVPST